MYIFQSLYRRHFIETPSVVFENYYFRTSDPSLAEELRKRCGADFWEITSALEKPKVVLRTTRGKRLTNIQENEE